MDGKILSQKELAEAVLDFLHTHTKEFHQEKYLLGGFCNDDPRFLSAEIRQVPLGVINGVSVHLSMRYEPSQAMNPRVVDKYKLLNIEDTAIFMDANFNDFNPATE